jgi:hypothetical protein
VSRKKAIEWRVLRPLINEKPKLPPDADGNRQQRRLDRRLPEEAREAIAAPREAQALVDFLEAIPNWEKLSDKKLGKLLGVRPERAKVLRSVILSDPLYREYKGSDAGESSAEPS